MSDAPLYRTFVDHLRLHGGDDEIVIDGVTGRVHALSPEQARVLAACRGSRSLDEHAVQATKLLGSAGPQGAAARALIEALVWKGLLVEEGSLLARAAASARPERPAASIEIVGIPTKDRPACLAEHLRAHAAHARRYGRAITFVVADGSIGDSARAARDLLGGLSREGIAIRVAGREERARFAPLIAARSGVDRDLVDFALLGDPRLGSDSGASRNAALLDAAGEPLLFTDDDVRPRLVAPPAPDPADREPARAGVAFVSGDPNELWFADPGAKLVPEDRFEDVDLVALHEGLLGADVARSIGASEGADTSGASATFFRRLIRRGGRVAITQIGSAGDHGMGSSFGLLLATGASRARLTASEGRLVRALEKRLAIKCPARLTIADGPSCMTMCTGLDARSLLPPFAPSGRDSDGLFGALVRMGVPDAFTGLIPRAIEHVPPEPRGATIEEEQRAAGRATVNELLRLALTATFDARDTTAEALLARAGRTLHGLVSRPKDADAFFREHVVRGLARRIAQIDRLLAEHGRRPAFWASRLDGFAASLRVAIAHPTAHLPFDLVAAHGPDRARAIFFEHAARVGRLFEAWPSLFAAARALREDGERLSLPMAGAR